eukprot:1475757-Alexandrium_andersonii.AAC.1
MRGLWTGQHKQHWGQGVDANCPWCGGQEDLFHLLWRCPRFTQLREEFWSEGAVPSPEDLPLCLASAGIAPVLRPFGGGVLWGGQHRETALPEWPERAEDVASQFAQLVAEFQANGQPDCSRFTEAQLLAHLQGTGEGAPLPDPRRVDGPPPEQANLYADGGVSRPKRPDMSVSGVGVWAIGVVSEAEEVQEGMHDLHMSRQCEDGLEMWAPLVGVRPSSTRTEAWALAVALR